MSVLFKIRTSDAVLILKRPLTEADRNLKKKKKQTQAFKFRS